MSRSATPSVNSRRSTGRRSHRKQGFPTRRTRIGRRIRAGTAAVAERDRREPLTSAARACAILAYSVCGLARFVVDCETLLRIAAGEIDVAAGHKLVAPTLVRSQAWSALYEAARRGEIST